MRTKLAILVVAVFTMSVALWAATNPLNGTWKTNVAKSKYTAGYPVPKSSILTYNVTGNEMMATTESVNANETTTSSHFTANFDGKDYPVTGDPNRDMATLKRINARTIESISKKGGKTWRTSRLSVSKDGKVLTIKQKGTRDGKAFNNVVVYDKQ